TRTVEAATKDIVNYQQSIRETNTTVAPVRIKRISVAAVLDGTYEGGHFKALPQDRIDSIKGLVAATVGADLTRGDTVDIQSAALSQPYVPPVPDPLTQIRSFMRDPMHLYGAIGAGVVLLIALVAMLKMMFSRRRRRKQIVKAQAPSVAAAAVS